MKNLILTILTVFAFSFSFAQSNVSKEDAKIKEAYAEMKVNSVDIVKYLSYELKLEREQEAVLSNAFSEYVFGITQLNEKMSMAGSKINNKARMQKTQQLVKLRDNKVKAVLKKYQIESYEKASKAFDPITLKYKKKK